MPCDLPPGADFLRTTFPRGGNLNGLACLLGQLNTLHACAGDAEWVLKVDSDTVVRGLTWLAGRAEPLVGFCAEARALYGACYAVRGTSIRPFYRAAAEMDFRGVRAEDLMMAAVGRRLGMHAHESRVEGPYFAGWHWGYKNPNRMVEVYRERYEVIVVQPSEAAWKTIPGRALVAAQMRELAR